MRKFIDIKSQSLFQSDYIRLQSVMSSITVQAVPSKKKKAKEKKRMKRKRRKREKWKRRKEEKGMERVYTGGKGKGENEIWKER